MTLEKTTVIDHDHETPSQRAERVGRALAALRAVRLPEPRQTALLQEIETLRVMSLHRQPGEGTMALRVIQPSGAGKSEAAKQYKAFVEAQPGRDPGKRPVVHVTLDTTGTPRSMSESILTAYGDEYASDGKESLLLKRVRKAIEMEGTELLIIDELKHCSEKVMGKDVSNTLKNMLTEGWVPIVFLGTDKAKRLFRENRELSNRCRPQLSLQPLAHRIDTDLVLWEGFLGGMDAEIVRLKLLPEASGLAEPELAKALCEACGGLIGEFLLVLWDAFAVVVARRGRYIEVADLHHAVDVRYVLEGHLDANPLDPLLHGGATAA